MVIKVTSFFLGGGAIAPPLIRPCCAQQGRYTPTASCGHFKYSLGSMPAIYKLVYEACKACMPAPGLPLSCGTVVLPGV